jgi:hypothetical protein
MARRGGLFLVLIGAGLLAAIALSCDALVSGLVDGALKLVVGVGSLRARQASETPV